MQANVGVIVAGVLVMLTGSAWPDLVIGIAICGLVVRGGVRILLNAASVAPGIGGSATVANDGRYGDLAGKVVALEPATGFSFDSPMQARALRRGGSTAANCGLSNPCAAAARGPSPG